MRLRWNGAMWSCLLYTIGSFGSFAAHNQLHGVSNRLIVKSTGELKELIYGAVGEFIWWMIMAGWQWLRIGVCFWSLEFSCGIYRSLHCAALSLTWLSEQGRSRNRWWRRWMCFSDKPNGRRPLQRQYQQPQLDRRLLSWTMEPKTCLMPTLGRNILPDKTDEEKKTTRQKYCFL